MTPRCAQLTWANKTFVEVVSLGIFAWHLTAPHRERLRSDSAAGNSGLGRYLSSFKTSYGTTVRTGGICAAISNCSSFDAAFCPTGI